MKPRVIATPRVQEVDDEYRCENRAANQPDYIGREVDDGDDESCQDQENERVNACASTKLYLLSLSVEQETEGEGAQDIGDGGADDVAKSRR
jgi:hypothetical protein